MMTTTSAPPPIIICFLVNGSCPTPRTSAARAGRVGGTPSERLGAPSLIAPDSAVARRALVSTTAPFDGPEPPTGAGNGAPVEGPDVPVEIGAAGAPVVGPEAESD